MPAPRNNHNAAGKRVERERIGVSLSIAGELRSAFEQYLLNQGIQPTEDEVRRVARAWAYQDWQARLLDKGQAIIIV